MFTIEFYSTISGKKPAKDFIFTLDEKMQAKVLRNLDLLEVNGPALRMPYSESLEDGIFELRSKVSSNITRIFYFFYVDKKIILTNGFTKKSQKTPPKELQLAKKYKADYERRYSRE